MGKKVISVTLDMLWFLVPRIVLNISETDNLLPTAFTENDKKKRTYPVSGKKALLMTENS